MIFPNSQTLLSLWCNLHYVYFICILIIFSIRITILNSFLFYRTAKLILIYTRIKGTNQKYFVDTTNLKHYQRPQLVVPRKFSIRYKIEICYVTFCLDCLQLSREWLSKFFPKINT